MIIAFLKNRHVLREQNKTDISFNSKNEIPKKVNDCKPISLCNVSYKFILKISSQ